MKPEDFLPGLALFAAGFVVLFGLLAAVGALAKSKQLPALRGLASGAHGAGKRRLFFVACGLLAVGACGSFAGVARHDARRARACVALCVERGHSSGRIGPASTPAPKHPVPVCRCEGGDAPWEVSVRALGF